VQPALGSVQQIDDGARIRDAGSQHSLAIEDRDQLDVVGPEPHDPVVRPAGVAPAVPCVEPQPVAQAGYRAVEVANRDHRVVEPGDD